MKLAIVTETFPPEINGVAMTFGRVARELARRGHEVTVCRPRRHDLPAAGSAKADLPPAGAQAEFTELLVPGIPIPGYPLLRLGLPAAGKLRRRWRADRPDLVHVVTEGPLGSSAIAAARRLGLPVTSSFHTNFHAYTRHYGFAVLHRVALAWLRRVHNRTLRTFAPTTELCDELRALGFANLHLLSRGVDTAHFSPDHRQEALRHRWHAGPGDPVVLHVGRMAAEKNYPLIFRAFAAMRAANPRCRFVLVGDGPLRPALQRAHPECIFPGFIPRAELARHYASADLYIHASLTETFGNVLTEAMASGLAVAAFDYAAARQFVRHEQNGLAIPCREPDALIAAATRLAIDAPLRARLRTAARAALLAQSWENVIARFESDLLEVIAGSPPRGADFTPAPALVSETAR
ncbi:MAG TPA: glycosyltransferase family 1 protein [Opitutus sp.]|nr:glycosyltransferase family 1 protein [Opitutus sp.]